MHERRAISMGRGLGFGASRSPELNMGNTSREEEAQVKHGTVAQGSWRSDLRGRLIAARMVSAKQKY